MPKIDYFKYSPGRAVIMCPGCNDWHIINHVEQNDGTPVWGFNGSAEKPTFTPSLLVRTGSHAQPGYEDDPMVPPSTCHSYITDGRIQFLADSTHKLAGQTVDLPEIKLHDQTAAS